MNEYGVVLTNSNHEFLAAVAAISLSAVFRVWAVSRYVPCVFIATLLLLFLICFLLPMKFIIIFIYFSVAGIKLLLRKFFLYFNFPFNIPYKNYTEINSLLRIPDPFIFKILLWLMTRKHKINILCFSATIFVNQNALRCFSTSMTFYGC